MPPDLSLHLGEHGVVATLASQELLLPAFRSTQPLRQVADARAQAIERVRLDDCSSLSESLKTISDYIKQNKPDSWILGGGWNANNWSDGFPHKEHLDRISPDFPIVLYNNYTIL